MDGRERPDPLTRLLSHAVVGLGVGYIFGRQGGAAGFWIGAIGGAIAHEEPDAPLARALSEAGI